MQKYFYLENILVFLSIILALASINGSALCQEKKLNYDYTPLSSANITSSLPYTNDDINIQNCNIPYKSNNNSDIRNFYLPNIRSYTYPLDSDPFNENYNSLQTQEVIASGEVSSKWHFIVTGFSKKPTNINYTGSNNNSNSGIIGSGQIHFGLSYHYD